MTNGLTINQEKQIRALRAKLVIPDKLAEYEKLAAAIRQYRRAQRLVGSDGSELRKKLLAEIDACLEALDA